MQQKEIEAYNLNIKVKTHKRVYLLCKKIQIKDL